MQQASGLAQHVRMQNSMLIAKSNNKKSKSVSKYTNSMILNQGKTGIDSVNKNIFYVGGTPLNIMDDIARQWSDLQIVSTDNFNSILIFKLILDK